MHLKSSMRNMALDTKALNNLHVLVTGGFGFVGTHLVRKLHERGVGRITVVERNDDGRESFPNVTRVYCDLSDSGSIAILQTIGDVDFVFNCAGFTDQQMPHPNPEVLWKANVLTFLNLTRALDWGKVIAGVHIGTVAEYGNQEPPFYEHQPLQPTNVYGWSKAASTQYARMMTAQGYAKWRTARLFMAYGPGQKTGFIADIIRALARGETFEVNASTVTRDLIFIDDVAEGLIHLAFCAKAMGETVNLCRGKEITLRKIAQSAHKQIKSGKVIFASRASRQGDFLRSYGSTKKLKQLTGWRPRIGIEEGLHRTISACIT